MSQSVTISVLVDNTVFRSGLLAEHGLSFWVEYGSQRILFDTGQSGTALVHNAQCLGLDLRTVDAIFLSHGHYDHTGGLTAVSRYCPEAVIYLCRAAIDIKYSTTRGHIHEVGMPAASRELLARKENSGQVVWVDEPTEIVPGLWCSGPIPRTQAIEDLNGIFVQDPAGTQEDIIPDDQALIAETSSGPVVFMGCGHAGVMNTIGHIQHLRHEDRVYGLFGGLHLSGGGMSDRLAQTLKFLAKTGLKKAGTVHCSGHHASSCLREQLPEKGFYRLSTGSTVRLET